MEPRKEYSFRNTHLTVIDVCGFKSLKLEHSIADVPQTIKFIASPEEWVPYKTEILHDMKESLRVNKMKRGYTKVSVTGGE